MRFISPNAAASIAMPKCSPGLLEQGVLEVVEDFRGDTFRAVYTLKYSDTVYVLHAFRKKSKSGRATPRRDMELVEQRLREARKIAQERTS